MKVIKCKFKNIDNNDLNTLKHTKCILLISVGQEVHEGNRLLATIDLLNTALFSTCVISLYDSLQRYSMALPNKNTADFFHDKAVKEGDAWIERNKKYYEQLTMPIEILRWDMWRNHPQFFTQKEMLLSYLEKDKMYKMAFEITINKYLHRYCNHLNQEINFDMERARKLCFEYALEECVIFCLWAELKCQYEIYPNVHNEAMEATRKRFIVSQYPGLLKPLTLRFRNAPQLKPQKFPVVLENLCS